MSTPIRTCIGCRVKSAQSDLLAFRRRADGVVVWTARRGPGKTAYLCPKRACFDQAVRASGRAGFVRALGGRKGLSVSVEPTTLWPSILSGLDQQLTRFSSRAQLRGSERMRSFSQLREGLGARGKDA